MRQFIYGTWYTVAQGTQLIATIIIIIIFNKMGSSKNQSRWLRNKKKVLSDIWMFEVYWG